MTMEQAARVGDVFVTATGDVGVIRPEHVALMKDGAILANAGHFDVEIDVPGLRAMAASARRSAPASRSSRCPTAAASTSSPRGAW